MAPVAAAILPHPPLLVPELAGAAAPELDPLRAACHEALSTVVAAADLTLVIGDGPALAIPAPTAAGSFHPYGAKVEVTLPGLTDLELPAAADPGLPDPPGLPGRARLRELPRSLAVAAYLLTNLDPAAGRVADGDPPTGSGRLWAATVPRSLGSGAAAAIGRALNGAGRFGLVVMADLSACRTERAPGAFRPEAADFDARVADAFRDGDPQRLLALDPAQAADLLVAGRVPLQVLAGTFAPDPAPGVRGRVLYEGAPYGVGYLVALLTAT
jgi:hypothetical protein